jgi:nucleotidyltransferase substrate binding protein (TIGR01987 family)
MEESEKLDLSTIVRAQKVFEQFRKDLTTDKDKTATVQAFEFCYELSWKLMHRVLRLRSIEVGYARDTFRKAVHEQLIDDPELWIRFQNARNLTSHSYNKDSLEEIVSIFDSFSIEMNKLIKKLQSLQ